MDEFDASLKEAKVETLYIGFSGGLDSRVLLHKLCQDPILRAKLIAVHINHHLSPNADIWAKQARAICEQEHVPFQLFSVKVDSKNIEASARKERYRIFESLLINQHQILLLAHHKNDQAETLLLHLLRGAGIDGLSAMPMWRALGGGCLYRPFLHTLRLTLEHYAQQHHLTWIEDESNQTMHFNRNFLRHEIIPLLQERWPGVVSNLARTVAHCADARKTLRELAEARFAVIAERYHEHYRLKLSLLSQESRAMQKNILRLWFEKKAIKNPSQAKLLAILDTLIPAAQDANPIVILEDIQVRRYQGWLYCIESIVGVNNICPNSIDIRFRQGGETLRHHGQTQSLKKLFQAWKVPPWERDKIPLIYINNQLVGVLGYTLNASDDISVYQYK